MENEACEGQVVAVAERQIAVHHCFTEPITEITIPFSSQDETGTLNDISLDPLSETSETSVDGCIAAANADNIEQNAETAQQHIVQSVDGGIEAANADNINQNTDVRQHYLPVQLTPQNDMDEFQEPATPSPTPSETFNYDLSNFSKTSGAKKAYDFNNSSAKVTISENKENENVEEQVEEEEDEEEDEEEKEEDEDEEDVENVVEKCNYCKTSKNDLDELEKMLNDEKKFSSKLQENLDRTSSKLRSMKRKLKEKKRLSKIFKKSVLSINNDLNNAIYSHHSSDSDSDSGIPTYKTSRSVFCEPSPSSSTASKPMKPSFARKLSAMSKKRISLSDDSDSSEKSSKQRRKYKDIPRYSLTKELIRKDCEEIIAQYKHTASTKIISLFFDKLFSNSIVLYCSACGNKGKKKESITRPPLDSEKKSAILKIVHMAGFRDKTMSYVNNYLNTLLCERRKKNGISESYDGSKNNDVEIYNKSEESKARNLELEVKNLLRK